jgi:hypothetical protein
MAPHWKCGSGQPVGGSNPPLSAIRLTLRAAAPVPPRGSNYEAGHRIGRIRARACRWFPGYGTWQHPTTRITTNGAPFARLFADPLTCRVVPLPHVMQRRMTQPMLVAPYRHWYAQATESPESTPNPAPIVRCITRGNIAAVSPGRRRPDRPMHYPRQYPSASRPQHQAGLTDAHSPTTIRRGRARRGTSGALHPQSATAGLNSRPRSSVFASHSIARR